ncbi:MAG: YabP/YqfC family sporulation protein [Ruminococcus sp.]|nr:YabP/YqfC family sporulation protein [Ruminococcus sp.]
MFEKISERVREEFSPVSGIHIESNRELVIENCRRIEECDEVFMQFVSGHLRVQVWGSDLRAFDHKTGGLVIRGKITRIEFAERRRHQNEKSDTGMR